MNLDGMERRRYLVPPRIQVLIQISVVAAIQPSAINDIFTTKKRAS
jgi:hypothetical protein